MSSEIVLTVGGVRLQARLNDSPIADALSARLPTDVRMSRWGDEYYGPVGLGMQNDPETMQEVEVGTLAYWPSGDSLCIFFGPTPMSTGSAPVAASAVSVIGTVTGGDLQGLRGLGSSVQVSIRNPE